MKKEFILDKWFFKTFKMDEKETFINKVVKNSSVSSMKQDLQPFKTPGSLQSNVVKLKNLDPYFEVNMKKLEYLEEYCLFLISEFSIENQNIDYYIWFSYIDTMAQIFLNGIEIKKTFSAFIQYKFLLPKNLLRTTNTLIIIISPPMSFVDKKIDLLQIGLKDRVYVRRPAFNYGWDFAPRSLLVGIGEVKMFTEEIISFSDLYVWTKSVTEVKAEISVSVNLNSKLEGSRVFVLEVIDLNNNKIVFTEEFLLNLKLGLNELDRLIEMHSYKHWWPNGYGIQQNYQLILWEKATNSVIKTKFGIRTVKLILHEGGKNRFIFKINREKIFAKGANWVPIDSLVSHGTENQYRKLLTLAKEANFNMIRIWGGGVVENEIFYDICDELGLMIWHDFQFACSIYPENNEFLSIVREEISSIIKRLRNHPSIVLWCGNNENEWIDFRLLTSSFREENRIGFQLHQIKQSLCSQLDPSRPYWRTSPWSPSAETSYDFDPNSMDEGNFHDWRVWHGVDQPNFEPPKYEEYANNKARFTTEFGIQSFPSKQTIDKIFTKKTQFGPNEAWKFHNCDIHKIKVNMKKMGEPENISEWILFTQAAQAFGMKYAVELWRVRKFTTAGALIWQFNEPWPTICWSLIDYYGIPKIAYWMLRNSFKPLIIIKDPKENKLIVVNDFLKIIKGTLKIRIYKLKGPIVHKKNLEISIKPNYKTIISLESPKMKEDEFLWTEFTSGDIITENIILPSEPIDMNFPNPSISVKFEDQILTLLSSEFSFLVHIPDELEPNDNYFHLIPDVARKIKVNKMPTNHKLSIEVWNKPPKQVILKYD